MEEKPGSLENNSLTAKEPGSFVRQTQSVLKSDPDVEIGVRLARFLTEITEETNRILNKLSTKEQA